jgi:hypothetical protein
MTNPILLLDINLVTVRAPPFDGPVRGAAIDNDDLIDPGSIDLRHDCADAFDRGGPGCLNRFSASISGASTKVRLPSGGAAA